MVLPGDGCFVSLDYVGPHRNQYAPAAWEQVWAVNQRLPASLRQDLRYPRLQEMLAANPTEAVHSELVVETFHRYFTVGQFTPLGGAIAYPLLTGNTGMHEALDGRARSMWIDRILEADDEFLALYPGSSLFAYFTGSPKKSVLQETEQLSAWESEEVDREQRAAANGGRYYDQGGTGDCAEHFGLRGEGERRARCAAPTRCSRRSHCCSRASCTRRSVGSSTPIGCDEREPTAVLPPSSDECAEYSAGDRAKGLPGPAGTHRSHCNTPRRRRRVNSPECGRSAGSSPGDHRAAT